VLHFPFLFEMLQALQGGCCAGQGPSCSARFPLPPNRNSQAGHTLGLLGKTGGLLPCCRSHAPRACTYLFCNINLRAAAHGAAYDARVAVAMAADPQRKTTYASRNRYHL